MLLQLDSTFVTMLLVEICFQLSHDPAGKMIKISRVKKNKDASKFWEEDLILLVFITYIINIASSV